MSVSIGNKKKVAEIAKLDHIVDFRKDIRFDMLIDYHLLICRL